MKKLNVLIFGGYGNIGTFIAKGNHNYFKIGRLNVNQLKNIHEHNIDCIVFCAGKNAYDINNSMDCYVRDNLLSITNFFPTLKQISPKKFIFISSCSVYGDNPTNENSYIKPISINGMINNLSEKIIFEFCKVNNIPTSILRIFNVYGGKDNFSVLNHLIEAKRKNKTFTLINDGTSIRDFIHVEDVGMIINKLLNYEILPRILNIGTGQGTQISEIVNTFTQINGKIKINRIKCDNEVKISISNGLKLKKFVKVNFKHILTNIPNL